MLNEAKTEMESIYQEYKQIISSFLRNKAFIVVLLLVITLGYGFTLTNFSVGVDDLEFDRYFNSTDFIAAGRFSAYILHKIFGLYLLAPFWQDFLSVAVLFGAVVFWCTLIKRAAGDKVGFPAYIAFAAVFISYPAINELFIYMNSSFTIGLGLLLAGLSLAVCYEVFFNGLNWKWLLAPVLSMCFAIGLYESFAVVFLCGMCMLQILRTLFGGDKKPFRHHLMVFIRYCCVLLAGVILKGIVSYAIIHIGGIPPRDYAPMQILWGHTGLAQQLWALGASIKQQFFVDASKLFYMAEFDAALLALIIIGAVFAFKRKDFNLFLLFGAMALSTFALTILQGVATPMRANQAHYVLAAFTVWLLCAYVRKWRRPVVLFAAACLVLYQTRDLSQWFFNDYRRYQQDKQTAAAIGAEIDRLDTDKPVVFAGNPPYRYANLPYNNTNGISFIAWSMIAFDSDSEIYKFFRFNGFPITEGNSAQKEEGKDVAAGMPAWPKAGSVEEYKDIIVVNFGNTQ